MQHVTIILSGKRRSGKDYTAELIISRMKEKGVNICPLRVSEPIKRGYAREHGLDFDQLMATSDYKEKYRAEMIQWGIERRNADPHVFCREVASTDEAKSSQLWILSDARRPSDLEFFIERCGRDNTFLVRVLASEEDRKSRGWKFVPGVDDAESECGLDDWKEWDFHLWNSNSDDTDYKVKLSRLLEVIALRLT